MGATAYVEKDIKVGDLSLHYQEWGDPDAPPIIMLHGFALSGHMFDEFAGRVQDRYHLFALDQRGHGDSEWAEDGDYSRDAFVADIGGFADALGLDTFILMGHSMGGMNSVQFAAEHGGRLRALVLVDVGPEAAREGVESIMHFTRMPAEVDFEEYVKRTHQFNPRRTEANIRERLGFRLKPTENGKWTWKFDKRFRDPESGVRVGSEHSNDEMWATFKKVAVPTLLVRGAESDILTSEVAGKTVAEMSDARLAVVADAGHSVPGDNPDGFTAAVEEFLASLDAAPTAEPVQLAESDIALPPAPALDEAVDEQRRYAHRPGAAVYVAAGVTAVFALAAIGFLLQQRRRRPTPQTARERAASALHRVPDALPRSRDDLVRTQDLANELAHTLTELARRSAILARQAARDADIEQAEHVAQEALAALQGRARDASQRGQSFLHRRQQQQRRWMPFPRRRRSLLDRVLDTALSAAINTTQRVAAHQPPAQMHSVLRWRR